MRDVLTQLHADDWVILIGVGILLVCAAILTRELDK